LNAAVTRSPLLRLSIRSTGRIIDAVLLEAFLCREPLRLDVAVSLTARDEDDPAAAAAAERTQRIRRLARQFETIRRAGTLAKRETGVHSLWFGWPLVYVALAPDPNRPAVLAPVFLFPAAIEPDRRRETRVVVRRADEVGPPRLNAALVSWLACQVGVALEPPAKDEPADWQGKEFAA